MGKNHCIRCKVLFSWSLINLPFLFDFYIADTSSLTSTEEKSNVKKKKKKLLHKLLGKDKSKVSWVVRWRQQCKTVIFCEVLGGKCGICDVQQSCKCSLL